MLEAQLAPLTVADFEQIYRWEGGRCGRDIPIDNDRTVITWHQISGGHIGWTVTLFDRDGVALHAQRGSPPRILPLERILYRDRRLRGAPDQRGKVLFNGLTCFAPSYCGRGLGRDLCEREFDLMRRWGAREVHLEAACEALKVGSWFRLGFQLEPNFKAALEVDWEEFQVNFLERSREQLAPLGDRWEDWHPEYQASLARDSQQLTMYRSIQ